MAENTIIYRVRHAREFLQGKYQRRHPILSDIKPRDVTEFIVKDARQFKPGSVKVRASSLRSYLKFLCLRGLCPRSLSYAVPSVAQWKQSGIPKTISEEKIKRFFSTLDRSTSTGRRDYAMCLCLSELALRASDVAALRLDDVDWREGTLRISGGKTRRSRILPLPKKVGRAIVDYLRNGRPESKARQIFLRHSVPKGMPIGSSIVQNAVERGYLRGEFGKQRISPHVFRHTAASRMHEKGATFKEIADVLGHQQIDTVAIYAKVNLSQLSKVALPWPQEGKS
jgi:site-specific recombinase XerD